MNLAEFREKKVLAEGERIGLYFKGKAITNFETQKNSQKLTSAFKSLGVKRGDRVIIQMPNCPEVLESFGACWRMGAVIVPINFLMGDEGEERVKKTYGGNYERLVAIKKKYDPDNFFRVNQNIKPN